MSDHTNDPTESAPRWARPNLSLGLMLLALHAALVLGLSVAAASGAPGTLNRIAEIDPPKVPPQYTAASSARPAPILIKASLMPDPSRC